MKCLSLHEQHTGCLNVTSGGTYSCHGALNDYFGAKLGLPSYCEEQANDNKYTTYLFIVLKYVPGAAISH